MTQLNKPVRRETLSITRDRGSFRPILIELHPTHAVIRLKGRRLRWTATYQQIMTIAAKNAAEEIRKERAEARKSKKGAK